MPENVAHQQVTLVESGVQADILDLTNANPLAVAILDGAGNQVTSFGGSGGTSATDDAAFTAGSGSGTPMMGFATSDSVDSGDVGAVKMLTNRQLAVTLFDSAGVELAVGGGTQYTEDAAAAANPVGNALIAVRSDARASGLVSADGDNVALRGSDAGELYVKTLADEQQLDYDTGAGTEAVTMVGLALPGSGGPVAGGTTTNPIQVADAGGSLTVDGTVTANLAAGTNNIGDVDVASIAAGDTLIGRVKLSDGTDVADVFDLLNTNPLAVAIVDGSGDQITSFGGGTQYTEDAAAAANPVGTAVILVRADTPAGVVSADGDNVAQRGTNYGAAYVQIVSSSGAYVDSFGGGTQYTEGDTDASITGTAMLWEDASDTLRAVSAAKPLPVGDAGGSLTVDNAGTFAVQAAQSGTWNVTNVSGTVSLPTGASTAANQATIIGHVDGIEGLLTTIDADTGTLAVVGGGVEATALRVTIASDSTGLVSVDDNGGSLTVDGTVTANLSATDNAVLDNIDVSTAAAAASLSVLDDWDETDRAKVNIIAGQAGITAGAGAVAANTPRVTLASDDPAVVALQILDNIVAGNEAQVDVLTIPGIVGTIADDATTPGAPVMIGGSAKNFDGTDPGNVSAEDDVTRAITDPNRRIYVNHVHPRFWSYHLDTSTAQTDTQIQAAPGANYAVFITDVIFSTGAATACNIFFEEGTTKILGPYYLEAVAGRGVVLQFSTPKQVTANTAVTYTTSASIAQTVDICGFIAKVN